MSFKQKDERFLLLAHLFARMKSRAKINNHKLDGLFKVVDFGGNKMMMKRKLLYCKRKEES